MSNALKAELKTLFMLLTGLGMASGIISPDHVDLTVKDAIAVTGDILTLVSAFYTLEHSSAQLLGDINGGASLLALLKARFDQVRGYLFEKRTTTTTTTVTAETPVTQ